MKKHLLFGLLFVMATQLIAQNNNMLSIEKLWQLKRLSEPMPSPDGTKVLYGVKSYDIGLNKGTNLIYLQSLTDGKTTLLTTETQNAYSAKWSPDGLSVTFLSNTKEGPQLFRTDLKKLNTEQLTHVKGGIGTYKFAPDGKHLAYTAEIKLDKTTQEIYPDLDKTSGRVIDGLLYRHWDTWHDGTYSHLFVVPVENGIPTGNAIDLMQDEKYDCPLKPHGGDDDYNWSHDGSKIAFVCKKETGTAAAFSTNSDVFVYRLKDQDLLNVSRKNKGYDKQPEFSPDDKQLLWLSMSTPGYESDKSNIKVYLFEGIDGGVKGTIKSQVEPVKTLTAQFDYTVEHASWIDNQKMAFIAVKDGSKNIYIYNPKSTVDNGISALSSGMQDFNSLAVAGIKNNFLIALKTRIEQPAELFKIELGNGKQTQISHVNQDLLATVQMGKVEKRLIPATDGKNILTWVIYPPDFDPKKTYPTLLYCQGGPQSPVSQGFSYRWNFQLMAAKGYIVVAPNRRGLPGFGSEWNDAITGDYGGQCMRDYLSAIDAVSKEPFVNKEKLGAVGASFGGYSVYWLAGNHQNRFKAFIAHCGMFNMESWYGSTEEMFFAQHDNNGPYWYQNKPSNFDASPHRFVQNWNTPILVIHNEKDYRVPVTQGMEAFTAAQSMQIPSKFLYFPDENHWVTKPQNSVLWQRVFFEWLDQWLKTPTK